MGSKNTSHAGKLDPVFHPKLVKLEGSLQRECWKAIQTIPDGKLLTPYWWNLAIWQYWALYRPLSLAEMSKKQEHTFYAYCKGKSFLVLSMMLLNAKTNLRWSKLNVN